MKEKAEKNYEERKRRKVRKMTWKEKMRTKLA